MEAKNTEINEFQYFEEHMKKLAEMYNDDQIIECIDYVKNLESKVLAGELISRENKKDDMTEYEKFKSEELISHVFDDNELFYRCWDSYKYLQNQKPDRSSKGIDNWFKYEEDLNSLTICARVVLKSNFMRILSVLAEIDLMKVEKFESIEIIKQYSLFRWLVNIKLKMPITISNREVVAVGFGTPIPHTKSIILPFRSVKDGYYGITPPPENPKYTRIDVNYGFYHIKYIDEEHCELTNCFNVDPKVSYIPWFVLNSVIKEIGYYVMDDLRKMIESEEGAKIYNERIESKKVFYDKIWNTIKEHINK
jgi:hypothetical protein